MSTAPRTAPRTERGTRTRAKLIAAAEQVFATLGYHEASIVKITEAAGVGSGTFYLYFDSKQQIFDDLVEDLNRRVRNAMSAAASQETDRLAAERAGFRAFFGFTATHPALYRIIRQAEFVSPGALRLHYSRIVDGYIQGLQASQAAGQVRDMDPEVAAWALMGIGELIGMRWVLWEQAGADGTHPDVPEQVFEEMMDFINRALAPNGQLPAEGTQR
ncbi:TetR/AcrR family transcriptional regulator [Glutamicibacter sp. HZAU]|uniref:TetR/AcrR family transcriptional regulator n=1 Tax=Glutamicibacter sp. HZAU TaxID=2049891 RepID=UPI000FFC8AC1|nr:TetR/AcrR family transcriptional regulator [Glutamicibacter sp. HZAU]RWZ84410.1 TetR/AcrR family transcriptional regulator [Glutamicibacter sp. HZAU]